MRLKVRLAGLFVLGVSLSMTLSELCAIASGVYTPWRWSEGGALPAEQQPKPQSWCDCHSPDIQLSKIGTPTTPPGDFGAGVNQVPFLWISPPNPGYDPLSFNFDFDTDILTASSPETTNSTSLQKVHQK